MGNIKAGAILHTKDGRKIGNAIITGLGEDGMFEVKTDYGNTVKYSQEEIDNNFWVAYTDLPDDQRQYATETHKYYSTKQPELDTDALDLLLLEMFAAACSFNNTPTGCEYDHMCRSIYEEVQNYLIHKNIISQEQCYRK